jgi:hypothetical protein
MNKRWREYGAKKRILYYSNIFCLPDWFVTYKNHDNNKKMDIGKFHPDHDSRQPTELA